MKPHKTAQKIAFFLICFSGVALAGVNVYQYRQIREAKDRTSTISATDLMEAAEPAHMEDVTTALKNAGLDRTGSPAQDPAGGNEADALQYQLLAAEEELLSVTNQLTSEAEKRAERQKAQKELQKKSMQQPAFKNAMREHINSEYADLFEKLNLSPEDLEMFKDLLMEEFMSQQELFADLDDPNALSKEEQEELNQQMQALSKEYESKKRELLGETDYATYLAYNTTQAQRYDVNNFTATLDPSETLTNTQKEALIGAMSDAMQYVEHEKIERGEGVTPTYSEDNISAMMTNYTRRTDAYLNSANSILSASQLEKFETYLDGQVEQYRTILEMQALQEESSS